MTDARQPPAKPPLPEQPPVILAAPSHNPACDSAARAVSLMPTSRSDRRVTEARPPALVGHRIGTRNPTVRRLVVGLFTECPWLSRADLPAAVRWGVLSEKFRRLAAVLDRLPDGGVITVQGDPRKALGELRALSGEITRLEQALGITAAARAALGVNVARLDLASAMARGDAP